MCVREGEGRECSGQQSARCSTEELRAGGAGGGTNQGEWESEGPNTLQVAWWGHGTMHVTPEHAAPSGSHHGCLQRCLPIGASLVPNGLQGTRDWEGERVCKTVLLKISVYLCVYNMYVVGCVCLCTLVQSPEEDAWCLSLSTLFP